MTRISKRTGEETLRTSRHARLIAFLLLAGVSAYGLYQLITGDWTTVVREWEGHGYLLALAMGLGVLDVTIGFLSYILAYRSFGVRCADRVGVGVYLSGYAGVLLPMKLGNLLRPDLLKRLGRAALRDGLKAEGTLFMLDSVAALALMVGWGVYLVRPILSPFAAVVAVASALAVADRFQPLFSKTRLALPRWFWFRPLTLSVLLLRVGCWTSTGVALYMLVWHLPGNVGWAETLFFVPASSVLGTGLGLPGGIGGIEGLLGVSLKLLRVPEAHLAFPIAGFRLATFWVWLPIGWLAYTWTARRIAGDVRA